MKNVNNGWDRGEIKRISKCLNTELAECFHYMQDGAAEMMEHF